MRAIWVLLIVAVVASVAHANLDVARAVKNNLKRVRAVSKQSIQFRQALKTAMTVSSVTPFAVSAESDSSNSNPSAACAQALSNLSSFLRNETHTDLIESALDSSKWNRLAVAPFCEGEVVKDYVALVDALTASCVSSSDQSAITQTITTNIRVAKMLERGVCLKENNKYCFTDIAALLMDDPTKTNVTHLTKACSSCVSKFVDAVADWNNDDSDKAWEQASQFRLMCSKVNNQFCYVEFMEAIGSMFDIGGDDENFDPSAADFNRIADLFCSPCFLHIFSQAMAMRPANGSNSDEAEMALPQEMISMCQKDGGRTCFSRMTDMMTDQSAQSSMLAFVTTCQPSLMVGQCSSGCASEARKFVSKQGCCGGVLASFMTSTMMSANNGTAGLLKDKCGVELPVCSPGLVQARMVIRNLRPDIFVRGHSKREKVVAALRGDLALALSVLEGDITIDADNVKAVGSGASLRALALLAAVESGVEVPITVNSPLADLGSVDAALKNKMSLPKVNRLDASTRYSSEPASFDASASSSTVQPSSALLSAPSVSVTLMLLVALMALLF